MSSKFSDSVVSHMLNVDKKVLSFLHSFIQILCHTHANPDEPSSDTFSFRLCFAFLGNETFRTAVIEKHGLGVSKVVIDKPPVFLYFCLSYSIYLEIIGCAVQH